MTDDPYRDEPKGPGSAPPPASRPEEPHPASHPQAPPEAAWMPPATPSPSATPQSTTPGEPYQSPQYQGPEYQGSPYQGPEYQQYQSPPYQGPQYQNPQYQQYQGPQYQSPQYQGPPPAGQPAPEMAYPGGPRPTNGLAIAALVCSLAGVVTLVSAPVGAVLGHIASRQIAQTGEEGAPLAKAAIWVGWIITGLVIAGCCALLALLTTASRTGDFMPR